MMNILYPLLFIFSLFSGAIIFFFVFYRLWKYDMKEGLDEMNNMQK